MASKIFNINHTYINRTTTIINIRDDKYNPMTKVIDFEHNAIAGYFEGPSEIIYGVYLDREFVREFFDKSVKVQLLTMDVNHTVEIFAHPHPGFQFIRSSESPGNKIRIRFRARKPEKSDIVKHSVYWDNKTGSFLTKKAGEVDAVTGLVNGATLKSGTIG